MTLPLAGKRILISRPAAQSAALAELIRATGGEPVIVPALEVTSLVDTDEASQCLLQLNAYDIVIFISYNAVRHADALVPLASRCTKTVVTPGAATASALHECGVNALIPAHGHDSEAMLALPELRSVSKKSVLIVRGNGGRSTLRDKLEQRGATVEYCEVYRRIRPATCCKMLRDALHEKLDAVCVASGEALDNLVSCLQADHLHLLFQAALFVPSARVAELALSLGFSRTVIARTPDNQSFTASLIDWANNADGTQQTERI